MIYLITGTNEYRAQQEVNALAKRGGLTPEKIDVDGLDANGLSDIVRGVSLFSEKRLVVLRQLSERKDLWNKLGEWAGELSADTTLVLLAGRKAPCAGCRPSGRPAPCGPSVRPRPGPGS